MDRIPVDKGMQIITSVLDQLRFIDPKIVPFDNPEILDLEMTVPNAVEGVFGADSAIYDRFREFRICLGHISLKDSHADKQMKYEMGLPQAIIQLEEILAAMENLPKDLGEEIPEISAEDMVAEKKVPKAKAAPFPKKPAPKTARPAQAAEAGDKTGEPPLKQTPASKRASQAKVGSVLLLHAKEGDMTLSVVSLLDKLGIDAAMIDESQASSAAKIEEIAGLSGVTFALVILSPEDRGGLPGLTAKIAKPKQRQDVIFELGYLVGRIGKARVAVLHGGERPNDIPSGFFGVEYLSYQAEGGWQISLIKLLKAAGYQVDANVLFE